MKLEKSPQIGPEQERRPNSVIAFKVSAFAAHFSLLAA